jgi:hypothetical protein
MTSKCKRAPRRGLSKNLSKTLGTSLIRIAPTRFIACGAVLVCNAAGPTFTGGCHDLAI